MTSGLVLMLVAHGSASIPPGLEILIGLPSSPTMKSPISVVGQREGETGGSAILLLTGIDKKIYEGGTCQPYASGGYGT